MNALGSRDRISRRCRVSGKRNLNSGTEEKRPRWGGRTSNPVGAVDGPLWVRLPLSSAIALHASASATIVYAPDRNHTQRCLIEQRSPCCPAAFASGTQL